MDSSVRTRKILYRRREVGMSEDDGLSVAWMIEPDGTERPINGGDPISRSEAERVAWVGKHILDAEP